MRDASSAGMPRPGSGLLMRLVVAGVVVVAAASAAFSAQAQGHHGPGMGGPGGGGMMMMLGGSPEHVGRMVDHLLDGLSASDAQRSQIKQIAVAAAGDLKTQREAGRALRERSLQIFTTPTVDANAAESVRQQMLVQQDQASKRMLQAMLEISRVLTPEQRSKIGERIKQHDTAHQERMQRMQRAQPQQP